MSFLTRLKISLVPAALALLLADAAHAQYKRTDFATNTGAGGTSTDTALVNSWGLTALPGSPFWLSDNGTGLSTLYTGAGQKLGLTVTIPAANGGQGSPTGIVGNSTINDFVVHENGKSGKAIFIFSTLDGTISGWNPGVAGVKNGLSHATIGHIATDGASYTGLAIANNNGENLLYAADDSSNRKVDVYKSDFSLMDLGPNAFVDPSIPKDFTPYGIQAVTDAKGETTIWVTYTSLNKAQSGFAAAFTTGGVFKNIELRGPLHSPWGIALAPADFGPLSNALLISNNISRGRIEAFDPNSGAYLGPLRDASGKAIEIDGVWAIEFGQDGGPNGAHNQLFFTGGPNGYADGVFGVITAD